LARTAVEKTVSARTPDKGPTPTAATKMAAYKKVRDRADQVHQGFGDDVNSGMGRHVAGGEED